MTSHFSLGRHTRAASAGAMSVLNGGPQGMVTRYTGTVLTRPLTVAKSLASTSDLLQRLTRGNDSRVKSALLAAKVSTASRTVARVEYSRSAFITDKRLAGYPNATPQSYGVQTTTGRAERG